MQFVRGHRFRDSFGAACIHSVHALDVWMPRKIGLNSRQLFVNGWPGGDLVELDILPRFLDRFSGPIHARLDIELTGGSNKPGDLTFTDRLNDPLTQALARQKQVLADVAQPFVPFGIGIIRHDRNTGRQRPFNGIVERTWVNQGDGDAVGLTRHRRVKGVDYLSGDRLFRAGPLKGGAKKRTRVLGAVSERDPEGIGSDVADEYEFPLWMLGKLAECFSSCSCSGDTEPPLKRRAK
jgi:hypothetical protein